MLVSHDRPAESPKISGYRAALSSRSVARDNAPYADFHFNPDRQTRRWLKDYRCTVSLCLSRQMRGACRRTTKVKKAKPPLSKNPPYLLRPYPILKAHHALYPRTCPGQNQYQVRTSLGSASHKSLTKTMKIIVYICCIMC